MIPGIKKWVYTKLKLLYTKENNQQSEKTTTKWSEILPATLLIEDYYLEYMHSSEKLDTHKKEKKPNQKMGN